MPRRHSSAQLAAILISQGKTVDFVVRKDPKAKDPNAQNESRDQQDIVKWWAVMHSQYKLPENMLMAFPLQGARTAANGARMKAEGMRKGTLDMFLAVARRGRHGLWIENKVAAGVVSEEQRRMLAALNEQGFQTAVCRSPAQAVTTIMEYLQ